jgi:hypothetical protein
MQVTRDNCPRGRGSLSACIGPGADQSEHPHSIGSVGANKNLLARIKFYDAET